MLRTRGIRAAAMGGALVLVLAGAPAGAAEAEGCSLEASSYDILVTASGPLTHRTGPLYAWPGDDDYADADLTVPTTSRPVVRTAGTVVDGEVTDTSAWAEVRYDELDVDLTAIDPRLPVTLHAEGVIARASTTCDGPTALDSDIATATLHVAGVPVLVDVGVPLPTGNTFSFGDGEVRVFVDDQQGDEVRAFHLVARNLAARLVVEVTIAFASAGEAPAG